VGAVGYPLLLGASAWTVDYTAAAEPPASTPAWTLVGTDHATASGGSLAIAACDTDQCNYYKATTDGKHMIALAVAKAAAALATSGVWTLLAVKERPSGGTTAYQVKIQHAANVVNAVGAATTALTGVLASDRHAYLLYLDRTNGLYYLWVDGVLKVDGLAAETLAGPEADSRAWFGKASATSDNTSVSWERVACLEATGRAVYVPPFPLLGYTPDTLTDAVEHLVAYDGTVETLYSHSVREISFDLPALDLDQMAVLRAFYEAYLGPGTECLFAPEIVDAEGTEIGVKCLQKGLKPRQIRRGMRVYSVPLALRVVP
jgi:hypothetical protein